MGTMKLGLGAQSGLIVPEPPDPEFGLDSFTGTNNTLLENHVPEVGGAWAKRWDTQSASVRISGGIAYFAAGGQYVLASRPHGAEYSVSMDLIRRDVINSQTGIIVRAAKDNPSLYRFFYWNAQDLWRLEIIQEIGVSHTEGQLLQDIVVGQPYRMEVRVSPDNIVCLVDDVQIISVANQLPPATSEVGVYHTGSASTPTLGLNFDNFHAVVL